MNKKCEKCNAPLGPAISDEGTSKKTIVKSSPKGFSSGKFKPQATAVGLTPDELLPDEPAKTNKPDEFVPQPTIDDMILIENMDEESLELISSAADTMLDEPIPKTTTDSFTLAEMASMSDSGYCIKCNYPLRPDETACPMCGHVAIEMKRALETEQLANKEIFKIGTFIHGTGGAGMEQPVKELPVSERRKLIGFLISYSNSPNGDFYPIYEGKNYVGRAASSNVFIQGDSSVSEKHLSILYRVVDKKIKFKDEQSSNGTYVNGELCDEGELKNFDRIDVGATRLFFMEIPFSFLKMS